jgi:hypothetical protein
MLGMGLVELEFLGTPVEMASFAHHLQIWEQRPGI